MQKLNYPVIFARMIESAVKILHTFVDIRSSCLPRAQEVTGSSPSKRSKISAFQVRLATQYLSNVYTFLLIA